MNSEIPQGDFQPRPCRLAEIRGAGTPVSFQFTAAERDALAAHFGALSVKRASAEFLISPFRKSGLKVTGRVKADVTQACVITLEPVNGHIEELVDRRFHPEKAQVLAEIAVDPDAEDPPEDFSGSLDLTQIAVEHLTLGLDPYPRAEGAELSTQTAGEEPEIRKQSPFAVLKSLKGAD
ncbi:MAG: DUF177 domain-containing protein [Hyphomicrobiaceae bacterium]|nr:DUF177 domain-containing protein [Hyphomicrobiaceae bacterium]